MRKIYLLVITAVLITTSSQAQKDITFGVKGGVNFASLSRENIDVDSRTGVHIGAVVEFFLIDEFSIQPELIYSQQGATFDNSFDEFQSSGTFKNDYINVPILGKYYPVKGLSLEGGPYFGFNINSEQEIVAEGEEITEDTGDLTSGFDFGSVLGVGYELPIGVFFQARYILGISDVDDTQEQVGVVNNSRLRNQVFQLSAGFKF